MNWENLNFENEENQINHNNELYQLSNNIQDNYINNKEDENHEGFEEEQEGFEEEIEGGVEEGIEGEEEGIEGEEEGIEGGEEGIEGGEGIEGEMEGEVHGEVEGEFEGEGEREEFHENKINDENNFQDLDMYNSDNNNIINYDENSNKNDNNIIENSSAFINSVYNSNSIFSLRIKPNLIRIINQIFYDSDILSTILNYLNLIELSQFRSLNRRILFLVHEYFKKRVKIEIDYITKYQENNKEKVDFFMKNIDSQIPLSNKGWLDFDLNSVANKLLILDRNLLTKLRAIKNIGKNTDLIYAPFCIIFGFNKVNNKELKKLSWKQIANKILNDSNIIIKIQNLDLENMIDSEMLEAFVFLNLPELEINNIKYFSSDFAKLILWCQGVVSYHILIHPYNYRNDQGIIQPDSEVFLFANKMQDMIDKFYHFKRFLFSLNIMKIPLADYVFNLQHNRDALILNNKIEITNSFFNNIDHLLIGNILSYIPYSQSYKFMGVSKKFYEGFKSSIDIVIFNTIKEIYFFRYQSYDKFINKIPVLYSHNIFSKFFLMLDDILNSNTRNNNESGMPYYPFLNKEQISNIKTLKVKNMNVHKIAKIFCLICNIKPIKKINQKNGETMINYVEVLKSLAIKGELVKTLRNVNKLYFNQKKIIQINEELKEYNNKQKLIEIKNINHGIYQLLAWELFVLQYLKVYNIFDFVNINYIKNIYEQQEIEGIKYYVEIMDYLKYHLKIKYHFSSSSIYDNNYKISSNFGFMKYIEALINYLEEQNMTFNSEYILRSSNSEWEQIGDSYFESKDIIPFNSKPVLYEKVLLKIISCESDELLNNNSSITNNINNNISDRNGISNINLNNLNKFNNTPYGAKPMLNNDNKQNGSSSISFNDIPDDIIIKIILFYLDINNLPLFSLINKKCMTCLKIHIFIRVYFLNKEKQYIEEQHKPQFDSITFKRNQFFEEFEMSPPSKEHAFGLMNLITTDDVLELKQCFRKYNKMYERVIIPFLCLLGEKPVTYVGVDGIKKVSYYETAKNVLFKPDFIKRIRLLELETIPYNIFKMVEQQLKDDTFLPNNIKNLSPCFSKLILWVSGVIEFHKVIRKYSLSDYDYDILEQDEIAFCIEMDNIILLYYKLLRYMNKFCKEYENIAKSIMKEMNI